MTPDKSTEPDIEAGIEIETTDVHTELPPNVTGDDAEFYLNRLIDTVLIYDFRAAAEPDGPPTEGIQRWQAAVDNAQHMHGLLASALAEIHNTTS